jgi:hypothetical protein
VRRWWTFLEDPGIFLGNFMSLGDFQEFLGISGVFQNLLDIHEFAGISKNIKNNNGISGISRNFLV